MKSFKVILMSCFILVLSQANAAIKSEIDAANKSGNSIFLVVSDPEVNGTDKALEIANKAQTMHANTKVISMNRSDEENKDLVAKYRLNGAPLPLILVIASNGAVTGGYLLKQATPELLVKSIPSPKKADVIQALSNGKSVFMVVSGKDADGKNILMSKCQTACSDMGNNATIVEVNLDDPNERTFLAELKVDPQSKEPKIYVVNSKGQLTDTFDSNVNTVALTASAKKVASSCCPTGSGKSCGPTKK